VKEKGKVSEDDKKENEKENSDKRVNKFSEIFLHFDFFSESLAASPYEGQCTVGCLASDIRGRRHSDGATNRLCPSYSTERINLARFVIFFYTFISLYLL
jgi:hypothetical protein